MEDFNKADVTDLPDLSGEGAGAASSTPGTQTETVDPPEGGEPQVTPGQGGQTPEGEAGASSESGTEPGDAGGEEQGKGQEESQTPTADHLSEMSGGRIESAEDLQGFLQHYDELRTALEKPEMLLPEGRAREAYNFAMQFNGTPQQASQSLHRVMSLNTESLAPKQLQFEAFMLREENADLLETPDRAKELFEREYESTYGDDLEALKEEDPVLYRRHELATKQAAKVVEDMQAKFQSETPENNDVGMSPEEQEALTAQMDQALNDFGGLSFSFSEDANDEGMNFKLSDNQRIEFNEFARNPGTWVENFVEQFIDDSGNLSAEDFANELAVRIYAPQLIQEAYKQGKTDATIKAEQEVRNPSDTVQTSTPGSEEKTFEQAWAEAMGG